MIHIYKPSEHAHYPSLLSLFPNYLSKERQEGGNQPHAHHHINTQHAFQVDTFSNQRWKEQRKWFANMESVDIKFNYLCH